MAEDVTPLRPSLLTADVSGDHALTLPSHTSNPGFSFFSFPFKKKERSRQLRPQVYKRNGQRLSQVICLRDMETMYWFLNYNIILSAWLTFPLYRLCYILSIFKWIYLWAVKSMKLVLIWMLLILRFSFRRAHTIIPFHGSFAFRYSKQFSWITGTLAASKISRINNCIQKQYSKERTQTQQFPMYVTFF